MIPLLVTLTAVTRVARRFLVNWSSLIPSFCLILPTSKNKKQLLPELSEADRKGRFYLYHKMGRSSMDAQHFVELRLPDQMVEHQHIVQCAVVEQKGHIAHRQRHQ